MKVKLFTANSMQEAMTQVKDNLGLDAVILNTRHFKKGGFWGLFGREMVEVMAAVDKPVSPAPRPAAKTSLPKPSAEEAKILGLQLEVTNIRKMMEQVLCKIPDQGKKGSPFYEILVKNDVDSQIAAGLVKGLPTEESLVAREPSIIRKLLIERITNHFNKVDGIVIPQGGRKVVALIGPTGVGKTTTVAKLAANFSLREGYKVALITADTYRIAAVEQLKIYSDIIKVPIEIVNSAAELKAAIDRQNDKQLILVDTAGRSPRNQYQLSELKNLLQAIPDIEAHLVLSTTTKYKDAVDIVNQFSLCSPQKILFTKIDETANAGAILNIVYKFPVTLSYVTTGQNVPDDIELADPQKLANLILKE